MLKLTGTLCRSPSLTPAFVQISKQYYKQIQAEHSQETFHHCTFQRTQESFKSYSFFRMLCPFFSPDKKRCPHSALWGEEIVRSFYHKHAVPLRAAFALKIKKWNICKCICKSVSTGTILMVILQRLYLHWMSSPRNNIGGTITSVRWNLQTSQLPSPEKLWFSLKRKRAFCIKDTLHKQGSLCWKAVRAKCCIKWAALRPTPLP